MSRIDEQRCLVCCSKPAGQRSHRCIASIVALFALLAVASVANAHAPQENYVWLNAEADHLTGRFEINVKDLDKKLGVPIKTEGDARLAEVEAFAPEIQAYLRKSFSISDSEGEIEYEFLAPSLFEENDDFVQFPFRTLRAPLGDELTVRDEIFVTPEYLAGDRLHRSLLVVEYNKARDSEFGDGNVALVFGPNKLEQTIDMSSPGSILDWTDFLWQGVLHIGIGLDHILFVVVLLLTVVVRLEHGRWVPVDGFRQALWRTAKIVTLFTIAHSITLTLAALGLIDVDTAIVESIIALSIAAVALNNMFPRFSSLSWILVFAFGLFHGMGFATVMADLQFRNGLIERILAMFNIGVEIGQLTIVVIVLPMLYLLRKQTFYRPVIVNGLSLIAILVSIYWIAQRTGLIAG